MKRIAPVFALIFLFCLDEAGGQEKEWTIEDCINYAITNKLDLKRQILQTETAEVNFLK